MKQEVINELLGVLSAADGLSAPAIRERLRRPLSQPTLWRYLDALRARGLVTVSGRGPATRYHSTAHTSPAVLRSRRLHEGVAKRLAAEPELRERVLERLAQLRHVNPHGRVYHDRWQELLEGPLPRLLRRMTEDSEAADDLRQESPLTILVDPAMRRRAFREVRTP